MHHSHILSAFDENTISFDSRNSAIKNTAYIDFEFGTARFNNFVRDSIFSPSVTDCAYNYICLVISNYISVFL